MSNDSRRLPSPVRPNQQLPMWPDQVRGGPNAMLRSALFAGIASKKRKILGTQASPEETPKGVLIAAQDGIKIEYSGTQLNQYDADVFFEALHRARREPLETESCFEGADFLRAIGRSDSKGNYKDLDQSLHRLRRGSVDIWFKAFGRPHDFHGSLIATYTRDATNKLYKVTFAKEIHTLFVPHAWTQLEWNERLALKGKPLAQWLHSYFSTHAAPYPISLAFIHEKTGSPTKRPAHFRDELKRALNDLHEILGWEFAWDSQLLRMTRPPSESQGRHLERKAVRAQLIKKERQIARNRAMQPRERGKAIEGMTAATDLIPGLLNDFKGRR